MTNVRGEGSRLAERFEEEFDVPLPGLPPAVTEVSPAPAPDRTQRIPLLDRESRPITPVPDGDAAAPGVQPPTRASRSGRFGAALFWMAAGWWLFAAVRWATEVARAGNVDGVWRQVSPAILTDAARDATDRAASELIALVVLSVIAALVLLATAGRRWLGGLAVLFAAGATALAWWHLLS